MSEASEIRKLLEGLSINENIDVAQDVVDAAREFVNGNWSVRITELDAFQILSKAVEAYDLNTGDSDQEDDDMYQDAGIRDGGRINWGDEEE